MRELEQQQVDFRREVQIGLDELDRGEGIIVEHSQLQAFFDDIQARARYEAGRRENETRQGGSDGVG